MLDSNNDLIYDINGKKISISSFYEPISNQFNPKYVEKPWCCDNNGSVTPDAVIRIDTKHEAENIYHTTDKIGREHFYMSEYYGHTTGGYYKRDNYVYDLGVI